MLECVLCLAFDDGYKPILPYPAEPVACCPYMEEAWLLLLCTLPGVSWHGDNTIAMLIHMCVLVKSFNYWQSVVCIFWHHLW